MTTNSHVASTHSVPLVGPKHESPRHESPRGDWHVEVATGCKHDDKKKLKQQLYGTDFCEACGASKGPDGVWRIVVTK